MKNIERFDAYAVQIFSTLYEAFPRPQILDPASIVKAVGLPVKKGEEMNENDIAQATIDWLRDTNFLMSSDPSDTRDKMQFRYVLAPKAFEALRQALPESVGGKKETGKKTLGEKTVEVAKGLGKSMGTEAGKSLVSQLVTLGIGWTLGSSS